MSRKPKKIPLPSDKSEIEILRDRISDLVRQDPGKAAILLTEWFSRPANKQKLKKAG